MNDVLDEVLVKLGCFAQICLFKAIAVPFRAYCHDFNLNALWILKYEGLKMPCHVKAIVINHSFTNSHVKNGACIRAITTYRRNGYVGKSEKKEKNLDKHWKNLVRFTNKFLIFYLASTGFHNQAVHCLFIWYLLNPIHACRC